MIINTPRDMVRVLALILYLGTLCFCMVNPAQGQVAYNVCLDTGALLKREDQVYLYFVLLGPRSPMRWWRSCWSTPAPCGGGMERAPARPRSRLSRR